MVNSGNQPKVLVIDDDADLRYSLKRILSGCHYDVAEAASGEEGIQMAERDCPAVILLDNRMDGMSGIEVLQHIRGANPNAMILLMTAYGTTQTTIEAMKFGAFDYIMKPFDPKKILALVASALAASEDLDKCTPSQCGQLASPEDFEGGIIGNSPAMQAVFKTIGQVAASDVTVMITGESGTGKELIARAICKNSLRSNGPYIAVNCAAIPENLIESELFGHEKGSFTGATGQRMGKFELCDGGTIFLDEIGDMALPTQTKILRALQEGEIQRVGGNESIKIDVRMLAATNKPLEEMVKEKAFREDLYYRLNVARIQLPPLRERMEDVPQLVDFVLKRLVRENKAEAKVISPEALVVLCQHQWPGNVRELENVVYRSVVMAQGETVLVKDLPHEIVAFSGDMPSASPVEKPEPPAVPMAISEVGDALKGTSEAASFSNPFDAVYAKLREEKSDHLLQHMEKEIIARVLAETGGKQMKAAEILGMTRATLRKRIERYDLNH